MPNNNKTSFNGVPRHDAILIMLLAKHLYWKEIEKRSKRDRKVDETNLSLSGIHPKHPPEPPANPA
jgi:hypothetical protein